LTLTSDLGAGAFVGLAEGLLRLGFGGRAQGHLFHWAQGDMGLARGRLRVWVFTAPLLG
jgi:hypothetical protein